MFYDFPLITNINDVLPVIAGADEFITVQKDGYTVINYVLMGLETFPAITNSHGGSARDRAVRRARAAIRRECRGIIFCSESGRVLRRAYHKFFNIGERDETMIPGIDWSQPYLVLEKLDGSMITPIALGDGVIRWTTKMGITDISMDVEVFVEKNRKYRDFAASMIKRNQTPIFEWCSRSNQVVIDHPEDKLILTGIRRNDTGEYLPFSKLQLNSVVADIPLVKVMYDDSRDDLEGFITRLQARDDIEGVVIRFENGHMLKIKTSWYVQIHRIKDNISHEKRIIEMIQDETMDDVLGFLQEADKTRLIGFSTAVARGKNHVASGIIKDMRTLWEKGIDRKTFALKYSALYSPHIRSIMFALFDKSELDHPSIHGEVLGAINDRISRNTGTQKGIDSVRVLWNNHTWEQTL